MEGARGNHVPPAISDSYRSGSADLSETRQVRRRAGVFLTTYPSANELLVETRNSPLGNERGVIPEPNIGAGTTPAAPF
jgi:hypothetical protein